MAPASQNRTSSPPVPAAPGIFLGVPLGELGWFSSLVMGTALGFVAFFAFTFCGIIGILIYNSVMHRTVDFALSYRRIGLPIGLVVLVVSLASLGTLRIRRLLRR